MPCGPGSPGRPGAPPAALTPTSGTRSVRRPAQARHETAAAIAVCTGCPVRAQCLELSLRHWDIGQHGIWGGLVAADRAPLRRRWAAGRRGRRRTALSGTIVRPLFPSLLLGLVPGGAHSEC
jgi:hypothetical protein